MSKIYIDSASIDITYRCNLNCIHCYNSSGKIKNFRKELTDDEVLKIIDDILNYNPRSICICGGETLLRKELLYKIGKKVRLRSPKTSLNMVTNGFLMTDEIADNLKKSGYYMVQISLDGYSSQTHNWIRQNDLAYEKAINAIKILTKRNFYVGVACAPSKKNIDEFEKIIQLCYELGVNIFRVQPMMVLGRAHFIEEYLLDDFEYFELVEKLDKMKEKYLHKINIEWGDPIQHLEGYKIEKYNMNFLTINAFGDILGSVYLPIDFGNLKDNNLEQYFKAGLNKIHHLKTMKNLVSLVKGTKNMDVHDFNDKLPRLGIDENIHLNILDENINLLDEKIYNQYFR